MKESKSNFNIKAINDEHNRIVNNGGKFYDLTIRFSSFMDSEGVERHMLPSYVSDFLAYRGHTAYFGSVKEATI